MLRASTCRCTSTLYYVVTWTIGLPPPATVTNPDCTSGFSILEHAGAFSCKESSKISPLPSPSSAPTTASPGVWSMWTLRWSQPLASWSSLTSSLTLRWSKWHKMEQQSLTNDQNLGVCIGIWWEAGFYDHCLVWEVTYFQQILAAHKFQDHAQPIISILVLSKALFISALGLMCLSSYCTHNHIA